MGGRFTFMGPRQGQYWFRVGTLDVNTTNLITGLAVVGFIVYAIDQTLLDYLVLVPNLVFSGQVWRLATWPFANAPDFNSALGLLFFWWLGTSLEGVLGRDRFLRFVLAVILVPSVIIAIYAELTGQSGYPIAGILDLESAVIIAVAATYPNVKTFFFGISFWVIAVVLVGINFLYFLGNRAWIDVVFLALVTAMSLLLARAIGISTISWIPNSTLPAFITGDRTRQQDRKLKRATHLKVVADVDVNTLLDKIAEKGIQSLTPEERRRLDEHSRKQRN